MPNTNAAGKELQILFSFCYTSSHQAWKEMTGLAAQHLIPIYLKRMDHGTQWPQTYKLKDNINDGYENNVTISIKNNVR